MTKNYSGILVNKSKQFGNNVTFNFGCSRYTLTNNSFGIVHSVSAMGDVF